MSPYKKRRVPKSSVDAVTSQLPLINPRGGIFGVPDVLETTLRYSDVYTLTSAANAIAKYVFRMNSLHDPDFSGTGHQPLYYDQITQMYGRYVVKGCKITCHFSPIANTSSTTQPSGPMVIGIAGDTDTFTPTVLATIMEQNRSVSTFLNNAVGGNNVKTLSHTYSPALRLGTDVEDNEVQAAVGSNPNRPYYAHVYAAETGLATSSSCNVKVTLEYRVRFMNPLEVPQS